MRINKFLSSQGFCSRRQADRWLEEAKVFINGRPAVLGDQVEDDDILELVLENGEKKLIRGTSKKSETFKRVLIAFNKPEGVESTQDARNPRNIDLAMKFDGPRVFLIGRLDVGSEGLILFTNDGDLVNPILRSAGKHEKEYIVVYDKSLTESQMQMMRKGVDIGDLERGMTLPCRVERLGGNRARIILTEGRNRQIRRMAEAVGLRVVRLKRVRIMNIELADLKSGQWRYVTESEEKDLLKQIEDPS